MTDITSTLTVIAPTAKSRRTPSRRSPGTTLLALFSAIGQAFEMAYAAPYQAGPRGAATASDDELRAAIRAGRSSRPSG